MRSLLARLNPRDRRALIIGAILALPAIGYKALIRPFAGAINDARAAVARERSLLERELALLARAPDLPREIAFARDAEGMARRRLFIAEDPIEAASEMSTYVGGALRAGSVTVQQIESGDDKEIGSGLREISLSLRAEGPLDGVLQALGALESGPRLLRVTRVSIERSLATPGPGGTESVVIAATVRGYAEIGVPVPEEYR